MTDDIPVRKERYICRVRQCFWVIFGSVLYNKKGKLWGNLKGHSKLYICPNLWSLMKLETPMRKNHHLPSIKEILSSLYVCIVNIKLKYNFMETPRKFIITLALLW